MSTGLSRTEAAIRAFDSLPLEEAGRNLLSALGYHSAKTIALDGDPESFARDVDHEGRLKAKPALFDRWREVRFLFQLTNDEIPMLGRGQASFALEEKFGRSIVDSFVFLAITLNGEDWTRGALAGITRAVNAIFPMPVIVIFRHGGRISLAVSERRANKRDANRDVQTGRISIVLGIQINKPHRGHLSILRKLELSAMRPRPSNFEELYKGWFAALSTKTLNESFYHDLSHWFFWARDLVQFPEGAGNRPEVPMIRLLTRVIFCWFIKERGLIPEALFRREDMAALLHTDPAAAPDEGNYYRAILQNLFFATLNTEMGEGRKWIGGQHLIHSLYRYKDLFSDPDGALELFRTVPFLNGGLFECLDRELSERDIARDPSLLKRSDGKRLRIDGFSVNPKNPLHVPNCVFFGDEIKVDLNAIYETKGKAYTAKGLFTLFDEYVFTVEENTSAEEEVALDPELLGKVFENLLASYNDETSTTARKKSGSFYTPRYVVDYMVRETLAHQFTRALMAARPAESGGIRPRAESFDLGPAAGELAMERPQAREQIDAAQYPYSQRVRALLDPTADAPTFTGSETDALIVAIDKLKVLDPACGSGAFPMGMLQALMDVLRRLDTDNVKWRARLRQPLQRRVDDARNYDVTRREAELEEAEAALVAFDEEFADNDLADYVRKLHLIEKCLYGSDIQPIAILIAKLRFFISLAVEQKPHPGRPNLGIKPLPNLETKLVAANSLIPLERPKQDDLFANRRISALERLIEDATQRHFGARTMRTKRKYRDLIQDYRDELSAILETEHSLKHDDAQKAAAWDPFDQNATAPFFDPLWMFQMHDGFDIVIGNPPYVRQEKFKDQKAQLQRFYERKNMRGEPEGSYSGTADYLVYFIERGISLLKPGGAFSYITSNKWYRAKYGENLRTWMSVNTDLISIIDFGDADVFDAVAYPTIVTAERREGEPKPGHKFRALNWSELGGDADKEHFWTYLDSAGFDMPQVALERGSWQIEPTVKRDLLARIRAAGVPLGDYVEGRFYRGILTGYNDAFVIDGPTRATLIREDAKSAKIIKPYLRGRDIKRWRVEPQDLWLIFTRRGIDIESYPAIKRHLESYRASLEPMPSGWRPKSGSDKWEGRKAGSYRWYEIQDNVAYWEAFLGPKIIVPAIEKSVAYAFDGEGYFSNDKTSVIVDERWRYLLACLNSSVSWWYTQALFASRQGGFFEFKPMYVNEFPVPKVTEAGHTQQVETLAEAIFENRNPALEQLLNGLVYELYFPADLHARGLTLFAAGAEAGLGALSTLTGPALTAAANSFVAENLYPGKKLRTMLSDLQTLDVVRIIEGKT